MDRHNYFVKKIEEWGGFSPNSRPKLPVTVDAFKKIVEYKVDNAKIIRKMRDLRLALFAGHKNPLSIVTKEGFTFHDFFLIYPVNTEMALQNVFSGCDSVDDIVGSEDFKRLYLNDFIEMKLGDKARAKSILRNMNTLIKTMCAQNMIGYNYKLNNKHSRLKQSIEYRLKGNYALAALMMVDVDTDKYDTRIVVEIIRQLEEKDERKITREIKVYSQLKRFKQRYFPYVSKPDSNTNIATQYDIPFDYLFKDASVAPPPPARPPALISNSKKNVTVLFEREREVAQMFGFISATAKIDDSKRTAFLYEKLREVAPKLALAPETTRETVTLDLTGVSREDVVQIAFGFDENKDYEKEDVDISKKLLSFLMRPQKSTKT